MRLVLLLLLCLSSCGLTETTESVLPALGENVSAGGCLKLVYSFPIRLDGSGWRIRPRACH